MDLLATAQFLDNFGEFVGSIAILVTLGYLAELLGKVGFPDVERINLSDLSPGDRVRLKAHCGTIYFHQENNLYQYELGLLDDRTYELTGSTIMKFMPIWQQMNVTGTGTIEDWYAKNCEDKAQVR